MPDPQHFQNRNSSQTTGFSPEEQQSWITWGQQCSPVGLNSFPAGTAQTANYGLDSSSQLVQVRYDHPVTWTVVRGISVLNAAVGDAISVTFNVRIGVGKLNQVFTFVDSFTLTAGNPSPTLLSQIQVPAQGMQVTVGLVTVTAVAGGQPRIVSASAFVAPVVE